MNMKTFSDCNKDDLIVITGAGGFIAGSLARYFQERGFTRIRAVDKKPLPDWYQIVPGVESLCLDVSEEANCHRVCEGARGSLQPGGRHGRDGLHRAVPRRVPAEHADQHPHDRGRLAGRRRALFLLFVGLRLQHGTAEGPHCRALKESDAYPAMAERGYGWEKLISEMFCQEYWAERGMKTAIARFHNVYGPHGTWDGGREKAPAAICRKVIEAKDKKTGCIEIWGDGTQTRSFMYIDDCTKGIDLIMHCDKLIATPINLGSSELISINELVSIAEEIGGVKLRRSYDPNAPRGVAGRNSDNTMIQSVLGWEPTTPFRDGLAKTYAWIDQQYEDRKAGKRTVKDTI